MANYTQATMKMSLLGLVDGGRVGKIVYRIVRTEKIEKYTGKKQLKISTRKSKALERKSSWESKSTIGQNEQKGKNT